MIVRKSVYDAVGDFNETLARSQDYEMSLRMAKYMKPASTDEVVFFQRQHSGVRGNRADQIKKERIILSWINADKVIFEKIYHTWPERDFCSPRLNGAERQNVVTVLTRGSIMARKKLWGLAVQDFCEASRRSEGVFTGYERDIIRMAFGSKYGLDELFSDQHTKAAFEILRRDNQTAVLRRILARGLIWRIREAVCNFRLLFAFRLLWITQRLAR